MSRMPSTSTGTVELMPDRFGGALDLDAQRVGIRRQHQRELGELRQRHRLARQLDIAADETDELLLEQVLDDESAVVDRLGDDGLRELAVDELGEEPLRRTLVDAEAHSRRAVAQVGDQRGNEPTARGTDHTEARVARVEPLQQREVGAHRLELAVDPTRAVEHEDAELRGLAPPCGCARAAARRARLRAGAPGRTRSTGRSRARPRRP